MKTVLVNENLVLRRARGCDFAYWARVGKGGPDQRVLNGLLLICWEYVDKYSRSSVFGFKNKNASNYLTTHIMPFVIVKYYLLCNFIRRSVLYIIKVCFMEIIVIIVVYTWNFNIKKKKKISKDFIHLSLLRVVVCVINAIYLIHFSDKEDNWMLTVLT